MRLLINRGNLQNPKSYPYWEEFLTLIPEHEVKEIKGILPEQEIIDLVNWADCVICIDSFLPHLIKYHNLKTKVICLWGKSDPLIFGYKENINLLKDRKNLRQDQFRWWTGVVCEPNDFVSPEVLSKTIKELGVL